MYIWGEQRTTGTSAGCTDWEGNRRRRWHCLRGSGGGGTRSFLRRRRGRGARRGSGLSRARTRSKRNREASSASGRTRATAGMEDQAPVVPLERRQSRGTRQGLLLLLQESRRMSSLGWLRIPQRLTGVENLHIRGSLALRVRPPAIRGAKLLPFREHSNPCREVRRESRALSPFWARGRLMSKASGGSLH